MYIRTAIGHSYVVIILQSARTRSFINTLEDEGLSRLSSTFLVSRLIEIQYKYHVVDGRWAMGDDHAMEAGGIAEDSATA